MGSVIEFSSEYVSTLVIENKHYFRSLLSDIYGQVNGESGKSVLSEKVKILDFSKYSEFIDGIIGFDINRKTLVGKISSAIEKLAMNDVYYQQSAELLSVVEAYINSLCMDLTGNISSSKINIPAIIKMAGICINDDYNSIPEKLIDYMELVREYDRDKLFIFVNMRSYFDDSTMEDFFATVIDHEFKIFLIDSCSEKRLPNEKRLTIDEDLCEF